MADTSITRRLSFGSRTFPIDKYLSGIDNTEMLGLHYIEKQHGVPFSSEDDLQIQQELFTSLKFNYMQNNTMLKMLENIDAPFDMSESDEKLKRAKQVAKEAKKEQQKVDQEIQQVITQIVQYKQLSNRVLVQQQYQEMQLNIRNNLAPLNRSCDLPAEDKDKDTKIKSRTIETQTEAEYEDMDDESDREDDTDHEQALTRGAARMAYQRQLTQLLSGHNMVERSPSQANVLLGKDTLSFELTENGQPELAGAFCDAAFMHGDILDYAAKTNDYALLCYAMRARLACRDAIAASVAQIAGAKWDGAWCVSVPLPEGRSANLEVDANYGTEYGGVRVVKWSALDEVGEDSEVGSALRKKLDSVLSSRPLTLTQVVQMLSNL